jgi:uncharacterized protein YgbK (DUF1537 family)
VELRVPALLDDGTQTGEIERAVAEAERGLAAGGVAVVYTSRQLVTGQGADSAAAAEAGLAIGQRVSAGLVQIVAGLSTQPAYLVAKGGITSSDVATRALNVRRAWVAGQILPGVPVWRTGDESRYPNMAYIVFPGNVGDDNSLVSIVKSLS